MDTDFFDQPRFSFPDSVNALDPRLKSASAAAPRRASAQSRAPAATPPQGSEVVRRQRELFTPLVEADALYLFHPVPGKNLDPSPPGAVLRPATLVAGDTRFARAFAAVWYQIPEIDRRHILGYWHAPISRKTLDEAYRERPRSPCPRIVLTAQSEPLESRVVSADGCALTFPDALLVGESERLHFAIARALAQVYRYAAREHYPLKQQLLDDPYEAWECGRGRRASQGKQDAKWEELQREYQQAYDNAVTVVLTRWGFTGPVIDSSQVGAATPAAQAKP
jgi:hypothetical protein